MKIAIIGSGFFGIACSLRLSKKYKINLYENKHDILQQASRKNQFRFHLGYHYLRSDITVKEIKKSNSLFLLVSGIPVYALHKSLKKY